MSDTKALTIRSTKLQLSERCVKLGIVINKTNTKKQLLELIRQHSVAGFADEMTQLEDELKSLHVSDDVKLGEIPDDVKLTDGLCRNLSDGKMVDILSVNYWKNTIAFKSISEKETQKKYYTRMDSSSEVLQLVCLESKPFGTESEKIIQEIFRLNPRTSPQHDGIKNGKKIEIKAARYWNGKDDCMWQHLEPDHDYDFAIFALLDFHSWIVWGIKKSLLMGSLRENGVVKFQGKQGWWVKKSAILQYLTPLNSIQDLDDCLRDVDDCLQAQDDCLQAQD